MELTHVIAERIFQAVAPVSKHKVSIVRRDGLILASSLTSLTGTYDDGARRMMEVSGGAAEAGQEAALSDLCLLYDKKRLIGAVKLLEPDAPDASAGKMIATIAGLILENEQLRSKGPAAAALPMGGPLSVLVGVHPSDSGPLLEDLRELGFDITVPHTTLFIRLLKINEIQVDAGTRELIMDERQVQYSVTKFLGFLASYFSENQDFVMTDPAARSALVLYGGREESDDTNALRLFHICEYLRNVAEKTYCLSMQAVIGVRCRRLPDYERQYEQLVKRLNSGRMLFPEKTIFWGHSILLGSLVFHLSQDNRKRLSSVLDELLRSSQSGILLETLHTLFECNMNQKKTAAKLFIHRNSLQYRLKKIEELTCIRLDDIDSLLSLRLALLCRSSLMIEEEE